MIVTALSIGSASRGRALMPKANSTRGDANGSRRLLNRHDALLLPVNPGEDFLSGAEWVAIANVVRLTTREIVVATLLLEGRTRKSIGRRLRISPETIRVHIDRLFVKFNVQDRLGLALRIARIRESIRFGASDVNRSS
jgi:DNA-binding NarL/FixJ family response regulator